jgi:hypothetical protein
MLFNFRLTPLANVSPWGQPGKEMLHWFGLTDGEYWLDAGDCRLLEYSEAVRRIHGLPRYCDYQVVRLYEDLFEILPYVLEPVPTVLLPYLSGDSARVWLNKCSTWEARLEDAENNNPDWDIAWAARTWVQQRTLDTLYLSPGARICMWSYESHVLVGWDNRDKLYKNLPAWSANVGFSQFTRESFLEEVRSFHDRLMGEMKERVDQVLAGALPPQIRVDLAELVREHEGRSRFDNAFANPVVATDWNKVQKAILEIEGM